MLHGEEMMPLKKSDTTVLVRTKTREIVVAPKSEATVQWRSRREGRAFKPGRFVIESEWESFSVLDLRVGKDSQFPGPKPRHGKAFQPDGPPGFRPGNGEFDVVRPEWLLSAKLVNTTDAPVTLRCHWIGVVRVEADQPLGPDDEFDVI